MLNILLDDENVDVSKYEGHVSSHFNSVFQKEWFDDDFVKRIIREIDETDVIDGLHLYNKDLGSIPPEYLSSGCKGLILVYEKNLKINGDRLGDNCFPILLEIAKDRDVNITLRHVPEFPDEFEAYIVNTGKQVNSRLDFINEYVEVI